MTELEQSRSGNNNWLKIVAILCLFLLIIALFIAYANPAVGYELDIYASIPIFTWIFLIIAMLGGAGIIIHQIMTKGYETSHVWYLGLLVLVLSRFGFLYIPYIRGYVTWNGDNISHWGYLIDVLNTGHLNPANYYPITHSFLSQVLLITNMPIQLAANTSTSFMSALFIIATYLLSTVILPKRGQQLFATVIAGTVMIAGGYNVFLMPNGWSILMLPLLFYFYFKIRRNLVYTPLFILLLTMYPLFHPLSALMIIASLLVIILFQYACNLFLKKNRNPVILTRSSSNLIPVILEIIILIPWILSFNAFKPNLRQMWAQIVSGGPQILAGMGNTLSKINMHGLDLIILYLKLYGVTTILIILSLIGLFLIWIQLKKSKDNLNSWPVLEIGAVLLMFCLLYLLYLFGVPGMQSIGGQRMLAYVAVFAPILMAVVLYSISHASKSLMVRGILLLILIAVPAGISLRTLYYSPYVIQPNAQITHMDMAGMAWLIEEKDTSFSCLDIMSPPSPYADGILGKRQQQTDLISMILSNSLIILAITNTAH